MTAEPIVITDDLVAYQGGDAQRLIDQATALVRRYCGWHVTPSVTETVTVDGSGYAFQPLPSLCVTNVASVTEDGALLDSTAYEWSNVGHLWRAWPWSGRYRAIVVAMTHGFADAPEVATVIMAVASRAQKAPDGVTRSQVGQVSETLTQFAFNQAGGLVMLDAEKLILDRYRLPPRP